MEIQKEGQAAEAKIWKFVYGFADSLVLRCAIELGIADIIHKQGEPLTLSQLGAQIPVQLVNTDHLHRLMRYLVHMKIFTKEILDGEARYGLAPLAKFILKGWDKSMVSIILAVTDKDFMAPWHCLKDSLGGEGTAFEKALGRSIWTYMADHPEKNKLFNEAMACDTRFLTSALIQDCKDLFQGIMSLVDVGGGTGTAMRAIAKAFPHLKCTTYDLPHVIADSPDYPEVDRIAGDMFKHIPSADAILLKVRFAVEETHVVWAMCGYDKVNVLKGPCVGLMIAPPTSVALDHDLIMYGSVLALDGSWVVPLKCQRGNADDVRQLFCR